MPFDILTTVAEAGVGDVATAFNEGLNLGLDEASSAFEAGITDANIGDFSQGPDGFIGSTIPGDGGFEVNGGFNQVDYNQPFDGVDTQPPLVDGGASVDSGDIYNGGTFEGGGGTDVAASVDGNIDPNAGGIRATDVGPSNVAPEPVFNPRDGTLATPIPTVEASPVDRLLTGASTGLNTGLNAVKAAGANAVSGLATQIQAELPKLVAQAKQQLINQAIGTGTSLVKSKIAQALPAPLARLANNAVDSGVVLANSTVNAPTVSAAVDQTAAETARLARGNTAVVSDTAVAVDNAVDLTGGGEAATTIGDGGTDAAAAVTADENQSAAETARLNALNSGPPTTTPALLDQFQAELTKATAALTAAGIPLPTSLTANSISAALAGLTNNNGGTANSATVTSAIRSLFPASVGAATATAASVDAAVNAAINSTVAGLSVDQVAAAAITAANDTYAGKLLAQRQQVLEEQTKIANNGDWRVRLSLAPNADYLYNASPNGILWPLKQTGGVIFPYTPKITTSYTANYTPVDLTHSNYKNYFYQNSNVGEISIEAKFTAQDTDEAQYLLAVIHFFRSVTRMFYGQDAQRGAPPPLLFLTGFGEYQFNRHPCVVSGFTYSMPDNVDYIRARSVNINGTNLLTRRDRQSSPTDPISGAIQRISNLFSSQGISPGAILNRPAPPTLGQNNPTYVPTSVDLSLRLLPMQSRTQVSQQFSVKGFANGDLIRGGFW